MAEYVKRTYGGMQIVLKGEQGSELTPKVGDDGLM